MPRAAAARECGESMRKSISFAAVTAVALSLGACAAGSVSDPLSQPATLVPDTKSGVILDALPPPARKLDVAVYSFPDLTGQNKPNDNFAEFSRATTQGGAAILVDVLTKAGSGQWFNVVERNELQALLQERQVIQNTRTAVEGDKAQSLPALRFAGIVLQGGIIGYDANETTGGIGANYLGIGASAQYRQDIVTVALRAVSVQTGRVLASVTTTKTIYSVLLQSSAFSFVTVDTLLQAEAGLTKTSPTTLAIREGIQLAVYALIFEGVRNDLWQFKDKTTGSAFMKELDAQRKAANYILPSPPHPTGFPLIDMFAAKN
jgi:curli production assembly/transport component CsgG